MVPAPPLRRPVRVCFVSPGATGFFLEGSGVSHGGAELQMFQYAVALAATGRFDVSFIAHGDAGQAPVWKGGVRGLFCPFVPGLRAKALFQKALCQANADVLIQTGTGSVTKEVAFHAMMRRRRFVYWIASDYDVDPTVQATGLDRNRWFEWGMLRADAIVAQTERQARALSGRYGRTGVIIPNAFPDTRRPGPDAERRRILWIGRFVPVKRPELFIQMAAALPEYAFLLVGPTIKGDAITLLRRHQDAIDRTPNLTYHPGVPFDESYPLFAHALALVNTSLSEGYPNTFVQAMQMGTPIASLNFDPDGVIVRHDLGVAPTDDDLDGFCIQLRRLLEDPQRRQGCGQRARQYFEDHHLLEKNVMALEYLLHSLTPGRRR